MIALKKIALFLVLILASVIGKASVIYNSSYLEYEELKFSFSDQSLELINTENYTSYVLADFTSTEPGNLDGYHLAENGDNGYDVLMDYLAPYSEYFNETGVYRYFSAGLSIEYLERFAYFYDGDFFIKDDFDFDFGENPLTMAIVPVPEPAVCAALVGCAVLGFATLRRRQSAV